MKQKYSKKEQDINNVLKYQDEELKQISNIDVKSIEKNILESEEILKKIGYKIERKNTIKDIKTKKDIVVPTWEKMCKQAEEVVGNQNDLKELFSDEEIKTNELAIKIMNKEFQSIYKLDNIEIFVSAIAGLVASIVDILLIGIPQKTTDGINAGKLSNYVREMFEKKFPEAEMEELANSKVSKVTFDAQDNRNTTEYVEGLSAYYHRLLSIGHDPFLGLMFGVLDTLTGRMTTIDKKGKIISQVMENYSDRKETDIFSAFAKQIIHFKSDITTSMGLPAPFMCVFNLFQFGSIGEEEQTIAEIVQGMYFEGYDFIQFCSSSISTMIIEVTVRLGYALKKLKEGNTLKESIPFSLDREKNPKLATMLFISHSIAAGVNAGKIYFTKNPVAVNYSEWITYAKYSYFQLKWGIIEKPELRKKYVEGKIYEELSEVYKEIDNILNETSEKYNIIF